METSGQSPLISIILPTHNRADVLPFFIESVLEQSVTDFELLIVGDGCSDHTSELVRSFDDPRIRWYDLPKAKNFGYANRNIAFRNSFGKYVGYMAHDDLILRDHFEKLIAPLEENPQIDIAYSRPLWVSQDGLIIAAEFNLDNPESLQAFLTRRQNALPASCFVHRRSCFERFGYWNEELPNRGDWDMWIRIIEGGNRNNFAFVTEPTCLHFVAIWKNDRDSRQPELTRWRKFYESGNEIPAILQIPIPDGEPEQKIIWTLIREDPILRAQEIRKVIIQVYALWIHSRCPNFGSWNVKINIIGEKLKKSKGV